MISSEVPRLGHRHTVPNPRTRTPFSSCVYWIRRLVGGQATRRNRPRRASDVRASGPARVPALWLRRGKGGVFRGSPTYGG